PVADGRPVEENRLGTRIELPNVVTATEIPSTSLAHDSAEIGVLENPAPAGPKPEIVTAWADYDSDGTAKFRGSTSRTISSRRTTAGRGFSDQSAAGQTTAAPAKPAASSDTFAFGIVPTTPATRPESQLKDLEQNLPGEMELRGVN